MCVFDLYEKNGVCVQNCGVLFYKFLKNFICFCCFVDCLQCEFDNEQGVVKCIICIFLCVFDNGECVVNCLGLIVVVFYKNGIIGFLFMLCFINGLDYLEGVLEFYYGGVWGMVCDDGWDFRESMVVCREFGLGDVDIDVFFGYIKKFLIGKQWFDDVVCVGIEKKFSECQYLFWGVINCKQDESIVFWCKGLGI